MFGRRPVQGHDDRFLLVVKYPIDDSDTEKYLQELGSHIGHCIISFNYLEHTIEQVITRLISERESLAGSKILHAVRLDFAQKVDLLITLTGMPEDWIPSDVSWIEHSWLKQAKKEVLRAAQLRNIIAHAKWNSISAATHFVCTSISVNSEDGEPLVVAYKLGKRELRGIRSFFDWLDNKISAKYETIGVL